MDEESAEILKAYTKSLSKYVTTEPLKELRKPKLKRVNHSTLSIKPERKPYLSKPVVNPSPIVSFI